MGKINTSGAGAALWTIASVAGGAASAYHGYKRNHSAGWAFGWFMFGTIAPFFALPLALAQGYSKPKGRKR